VKWIGLADSFDESFRRGCDSNCVISALGLARFADRPISNDCLEEACPGVRLREAVKTRLSS